MLAISDILPDASLRFRSIPKTLSANSYLTRINRYDCQINFFYLTKHTGNIYYSMFYRLPWTLSVPYILKRAKQNLS